SFGPVADRVRAWCEEGQRVVVVVTTPAQVQRLSRLFENHGVTIETAPTVRAALDSSVARPRVIVGHLSEGLRLPAERLAIVTEADIWGEPRQRGGGRRVEGTQLLKTLSELRPDDFVVHPAPGVGRYRGLKPPRGGGRAGDSLHLKSAGGDRLYLPVD